MVESGQRSGSIQSVERALAALKVFGEGEPELGVTELARRLKLHKSTVSRLLSTLEAGGFVRQDPRTGRYRLGLQLATLAGLALTQFDLRDVTRPLLADLAVQSGETTTLSVLDDDVAVNIDQVLAPHPVKHLGWIGRRLPLHCTAAGKPLLAYQPPAALERFLARPLPRFTPRTITNPALLRRELDRVRAQGFAAGQEEYELELSAVGAAVLDHRREVVASITVSGPTFRLPPARLPELGRLVRQTADRISARLGHRPATTDGRWPAVVGAGRPGGAAVAPRAAPASGTTEDSGFGPRRPAVGVAGPLFGK